MKLALSFFLALALSSIATTTVAQSPESGSDADRAGALYAEGVTHFRAGRAAQALEAFDASARLYPSPNTDLLRGHVLRALGRRVEAMQAYERVVRDAGERVRAGDARFEPSLADAGRWIAFLRTEIGELAIEIRCGSQKVSLTVDGELVDLDYDRSAGVARMRLWRDPGSVKIQVRGDRGIERMRDARIAAGATETIAFDVVPPTPKGRARPLRSHSPPTASWVAFGVGGAGFVAMAISGGLAKSKMNELDGCTPHCTEDQTDDAKTKATVANVSLVIGVAGVATGGAIWLGSELSRPGTSSPSVGASLSRGSANLSFRAGF